MDLTARSGCWTRPLAVLAFAAFLVGCHGESVGAVPPPDAALWKDGAWRPASPGFRPSRLRELAAVDVPWAGDPGPDDFSPDAASRVTVNLLHDPARGPSLYFKGERWSLEKGSRSQTLDALRNSLARLLRGPSADGRRAAILVRAAYQLPWAEVRDVLRLLADAPLGFRRVSFAVASSDPSEWREARIDADPLTGPAPAAPPVAITWSMADGLAMDVGEGSILLGFPAGEPYAASVVKPSNAQWRRLVVALQQARADGSRAIALRIDPRVPWAHVAETLGLLVRADLRDITLDGGSRWTLSTPPRSRDRLGGPGPALVDVSPALAVGIGAGLALLLFAILAATSRSGCPRSPRP